VSNDNDKIVPRCYLAIKNAQEMLRNRFPSVSKRSENAQKTLRKQRFKTLRKRSENAQKTLRKRSENADQRFLSVFLGM